MKGAVMTKEILVFTLLSVALNAHSVIAHISKKNGTEYAVKCDDNTTRFVQEEREVFYVGDTGFSTLEDAVDFICESQ
jgi:hypothetical protein